MLENKWVAPISCPKSINNNLSWKGYAAIAMLGLAGIGFLAPAQAADKRPNILLIVADDLGYSDIHPYGGEVATPTLTYLANHGLQFTNFHTNASSSPTRSMLLSGVDNHRNGFGTMAGRLRNPTGAPQVDKPGYEGYLNDRVVTIADLLQDAGYHTYMSGKWHMGDKDGYRPINRGFEESFALIPGGDNHYYFAGAAKVPPSDDFKQEYRENDVLIPKLPANFYSTKNFTDKMIEYIGKNQADGKPFFGMLAYTAPHSPLQAPQKYIDKYMEQYKVGWDKLRAARFQRQKELGLLPKDLVLPERWSHVPAWDTMTPEEQASDAKKMAVYAAMIDYMDMSIGRVVNYLKTNGLYENTIIVFMSDNGPEANNLMGNSPIKEFTEAAGYNNSFANLGKFNSAVSQATGFAMVSNTPYYGAKASVAEGGIRNDFIVSYPGVIPNKRRTAAFTSVLDVLPTALDYAGATYPETFNGKPILSLDGRSMRDLWEGKSSQVYMAGEAVGIELFGSVNKSLFQDNWKILRLGDTPWGMVAGYPDKQPWKLFNLKNDPTEMIDMSKKYPARFANMKKLYTEYEKRVGFVAALLPPPPPPSLKADDITWDDLNMPKTFKEAMEY